MEKLNLRKIIFFILIITSAKLNAQWQLVYQTPTNEIVHVASSPDVNTFWFITNFDRVYKTTNGGLNWTTIIHPVFIPSGLFALNRDTAFKAGMQSVYRTVDGGNSWSRVFFNTSSNETPNVWMKNNSEGVLSFVYQLYKTTDCGLTWSTSLITQPPFGTLNSTGKGNIYGKDDDLWVCLYNHGVAYSSDFGISWSLPANSGAAFSNTARIFFGSTVFGLMVLHPSPFVYVTTNSAGSWQMTDNSLGLNEDVAINNSHCWYIPNPADHFYIKYSEDSGKVWTQQLFDGAGFSVLEKSRNGNVLWAGTQTGKIYKYIDVLTNVQETNSIPLEFELEQNFPNPFNPNTIINYKLGSKGYVNLQVYDITGKEVINLFKGKQNAGNYSVSFDGSSLPGGIYFCELKVDKNSQVKKMMLLK